MNLTRAERNAIEREGIIHILALLTSIESDDPVSLEDIEIVTDLYRQYKGIDYIVKGIKIDSKYHTRPSKKQKRTPYGVNALSIEVTTRNGALGWGINPDKETDLIIDYIKDTAVYFIDSCALREYMAVNYMNYNTWYSQEGQEDYRGVLVADLIDSGIIVAYATGKDMKILRPQIELIQENSYYKENMIPVINTLQS